MKNFLLALLTLSLSLLSSCKHDSDTLACPNDVVGTWRLVDRECFCIQPQPAPLLQERLVIKANGEFTFYTNEQPSRSGRYSLTSSVNVCGISGTKPGIYFDSGARPAGIAYTVADCKLTLDYGSACDAPLDVYERERE